MKKTWLWAGVGAIAGLFIMYYALKTKFVSPEPTGIVVGQKLVITQSD